MGLNVRQQKIAISMRPPHLCPHNEFIEQGTQRFPDPGRNDRPGAQRLGQLMSPETATAIPKSELQGTQAAHSKLWDHYHNHITALVPLPAEVGVGYFSFGPWTSHSFATCSLLCTTSWMIHSEARLVSGSCMVSFHKFKHIFYPKRLTIEKCSSSQGSRWWC